MTTEERIALACFVGLALWIAYELGVLLVLLTSPIG